MQTNDAILLYFDGKNINIQEQKKISLNRAFKYGDGFFESMQMCAGEVPLLEAHLRRVKYSLEKLKISAPDFIYTPDFWRGIFSQNFPHARIRVTFFRSGAGLYLPEAQHECHFTVEINPLGKPYALFRKEKMTFCRVQSVRKDFSFFSELKSLNALVYVLAAIEVREKACDEGILFNEKNEVVECIASNIFLRFGDEIFTPPLYSGCVRGVMREFLLANAPQFGVQAREKSLTEHDLNTADEVWTTNAVQGIKICKL